MLQSAWTFLLTEKDC